LSLVTFGDDSNAAVGESVREDLAAIGFTDVELFLTDINNEFGLYNDPSIHLSTGLLFGPGGVWLWDYPDGLNFIEPLFSSSNIGPDSCCNFGSVTALDDAIAAAQALPAGPARTAAIEELNRTVTGRDALDPLVDSDLSQALVAPFLWERTWAIHSN